MPALLIDNALQAIGRTAKNRAGERRIDFVSSPGSFASKSPLATTAVPAIASSAHAAKASTAAAGPRQQGNQQPRQAASSMPMQLSSTWLVAGGIGPGLVNLGNTCFLNSVLQCMTYNPPLAQVLLTGAHGRSCPSKGFCAMCSLESHVQMCFKRSGQSAKAISPRLFVDNLKRISKQMRVGRQEDAHEFIRFLVEGLQKGEAAGGKKPNATITGRVFNGSLRSQIKCLSCKGTSDTVDPLMDISLDIKHCQSLDQAFRRFTTPELLNKQNQYRCAKCNGLRDAHKQITILKPPTVLTVQLKRFGFHHSMGSKISSPVQFQPQLKLDAYMATPSKSAVCNMAHCMTCARWHARGFSSPMLTCCIANQCFPFCPRGLFWIHSSQTMYDLFAVLVHSGSSCHSGHYFSFVKAPDGNWYCMNDSQVRPVSEKTVLSQSAYMLFYVHRTSSQGLATIPTPRLGSDHAPEKAQPQPQTDSHRKQALPPATATDASRNRVDVKQHVATDAELPSWNGSCDNDSTPSESSLSSSSFLSDYNATRPWIVMPLSGMDDDRSETPDTSSTGIKRTSSSSSSSSSSISSIKSSTGSAKSINNKSSGTINASPIEAIVQPTFAPDRSRAESSPKAANMPPTSSDLAPFVAASADPFLAGSLYGTHTGVWDTIDHGTLFKREEVVYMQHKAGKRRRPSEHEQEYDRPSMKKNKRKEAFMQRMDATQRL
ncbi:hypothetical protein BC831DRAFT_442317 [Entophlyctis helioformis]|nr:hypothetical protein BC831DRAFT_442317 [Entophlyctis helioformis]